MTTLLRILCLSTLGVLLTLQGCKTKLGVNARAKTQERGASTGVDSGFARRTLANVIRSLALPPDEPPGIVTFTGDHRSIARVTYLGKSRPIPESHHAGIVLAEKQTGTVPLADDVKTELLFQEGPTEYWMPVGTKTEPEFKNLKPGQVIDLYVSFVAALKDPKGTVDYVFVAQEYEDIPPPAK